MVPPAADSKTMTSKQRVLHYLILVGFISSVIHGSRHAALSKPVDGAVALKNHS